MNITVKLVDSTPDITKAILGSIRDYLDPKIKQAASKTSEKLPKLVSEALRQEPEYLSLLSGQLKAELGLASSSDVEAVIEAISSSIELKTQSLSANRSGIKGGFTINMIRAKDAGGVIGLDIAKINDKGYSLPWLQWLLFAGNEVLIKNYKVEFGPDPNSRSGLAIMKPSSSSSWRVPPEFVGSEENNWITRAITRIENNVYDLIVKAVEGEI
jgi:hypothetical protein